MTLPKDLPAMRSDTGAPTRSASFGVVVLTMGDRPDELAAALQSLVAQRDVELDVVVVGNGCVPAGLPTGVRLVALEHNVGVPEGRNVGAKVVVGDLLFFFDDDATLPGEHVLADMAAVYSRCPRAAAVQPRVLDPTGLAAPRRWVPRLGFADAMRPGLATGVVEGLFAVRRTAYEEAGGWPGHFFYSHEGIELVWRLYDAGWVVLYEPEIVVHHPATAPTRHAVYYRMNARNRVWVARRNLPWPLPVVYVGVWVIITVLRVHSPSALRIWFRGLMEGMARDPGRRRPISWRTVVRLAAAGRPPVV